MTERSRAALTFTCTAVLLHIPSLHYTSAQQVAAEQTTDSIGQYLDSLRRARDGLLAAGDAEGALEPAELVLAAQEDATPAQLAADQVMLAVILAELARFDEAEVRFLDSIEALQRAEGPATASAVTPLQLLGRAYIRARRFPQAITALTEARSVSRRTAGLFNIEQTGIIDDLTTAHLGLGDTVTARELQIARLETAQRQFGADDPQVIPYHFELADYYQRSRLLGGASEQFDAALAIAEANGHSDEALTALRNIASLELQMGPSRSHVERLAEAVAADTANTISPHELGLAHAVLGDAALLDDEMDDAAAHYARAWQLVAAGGVADPAVYFSDPSVVRLVTPASIVDFARRSLPWVWGTIALEFDVGADGRVESITGIAAEPAELMEAAYVERLESALFRPTLIDGRPAEARGVVFTHYFRYYVEPDDDAD